MLVAEILRTKGDAVFTVEPGATLEQAASELSEKGVGAVIVCDGDKVVGVFSERDLVRAVAEGGAAVLAQPVRGHMSPDVVFASPGETVGQLMSRMTERRIRHLPVLRDGRLGGVISIGDVVKCQIAETTQEAETLKAYIVSG